MVPLVERISTVSVSIMVLANCTPRSMRPSVTPVAANRHSPLTMSSIWYFFLGSLIPIRATRSRFSSVSITRRVCIWPPMRRTADAEENIDAGFFRIGGVDDASHVAVADQAHRGARFAHGGDQVGVARAIEDHRSQVFGPHSFGLGQSEN